MVDLYETGKAIQRMIAGQNLVIQDTKMIALASAYESYVNSQSHSNFHGIIRIIL